MWLAIRDIPGYVRGGMVWKFESHDGHWGDTNLRTNEVYISPAVPAALMYSVVSHEYSHILQMRVYGGDVQGARSAMTTWFGASGLERAADCMARELGAVWTAYTRCSNPAWRALARLLLAGHRL